LSVLIFDSGIGGLSVLREARVLFPDRTFIYVADDAAFPYGDWEEEALRRHMVSLFADLLVQWMPEVVVIACNTASTLAIDALRDAFPEQRFIGTVPAIKPAAERTKSGLISVLATPGTVKRQYTRNLIDTWASQVDVTLVGSARLAALAETYLRGGQTDESVVAQEISGCFIHADDRRTDIVVMACTHYPFLVNRMRKMAPWPVDWIDTSEAIARRAQTLLKELPSPASRTPGERDMAWFSGGAPDQSTRQLLRGFGLYPVG